MESRRLKIGSELNRIEMKMTNEDSYCLYHPAIIHAFCSYSGDTKYVRT